VFVEAAPSVAVVYEEEREEKGCEEDGGEDYLKGGRLVGG